MDNGWVDEGFGAVADAFAGKFTEFPELGAAVTVYVGGARSSSCGTGRLHPDAGGRARPSYRCSLSPKGW